jgi:hypothetical protein
MARTWINDRPSHKHSSTPAPWRGESPTRKFRGGLAHIKDMKTTNEIRASALWSILLLLLILAPLAPTQAASPVLEGAVPPANFKVQNEVLGKVPLTGDPRSIVVSDDGQHIAFVVRRGLKSTVWHDGAEGTPYQRISRIMFSPVRAHLAYIASKSADSEVVVLDGKELATHPSISTNSLRFSPDGKRIAYVFAAPTNRAVTIPPLFRMLDGQLTKVGAFTPLSVVVDGQPGREYRGISPELLFSPDSKHLAYSVELAPAANRTVGLECIVLDGVESDYYDGFLEGTPVFSTDSQRFAFAARRDGKWYTVLDGKQGQAYDTIPSSSLAFSPDSQRLVYRAEREGKRFLVVAGEEISPAGKDDFSHPIFSPDSQRMAIHVTRAQKELWLIDNHAGPEYDGVGILLFSPDSHRTAYTGRRDGQWYLVLDGVESQAFEQMEDSSQFSPDSRQFLWIAKRRGKYRLVSNLQEQGAEYDRAGKVKISPDSRHVAFFAMRGGVVGNASDNDFIVVDGREGPPYGGIFRLAFDGNRTIHAIGMRANPETFEDEIVRIKLLITEDSDGLGAPPGP